MFTTEMTLTEMDALLAEQLPTRELMTRCGCHGGDSFDGGDTNQNNQVGLVNVSALNANADDQSEANAGLIVIDDD